MQIAKERTIKQTQKGKKKKKGKRRSVPPP